MIMIQERYVSFEIAKLLKEKGFNKPTEMVWYEHLPSSLAVNKKETGTRKLGYFYWDETTEHHSVYTNDTNENGMPDYIESSVYSAPSLYMAMEWLREKYKLLISIFPMETTVGIETLCYGIWRITEDLYQPLYCGKVDNLVDSYEAEVEAAIKYSLENLI